MASDPELVGWTDPNDPEGRVLPASLHPALVLASADANDAATLWRMQYDMPPTDPRFLDADEDVVIHDLAVLLFYRRAMEAAVNPRAADLREAIADPTYAPSLIARNMAWLRSPATQECLATILGRKPAPERPAGKVTMKRSRRRPQDG